MNWIDKHLHGHWELGPITLYGQNAMHWAINIKLPRCYLCFRLPVRCFRRWWPLYLYISNNATPSNATLLLGQYSIEDKVAAKFRRKLLGVFYRKPNSARTEHRIQTELRKMLHDYVQRCADDFKIDPETLLAEIQNADIHTVEFCDPETELVYTQFNFTNNTDTFAHVRISESNMVRISYRRRYATDEEQDYAVEYG